MTLYKRIRERREFLRLTQEELASKLGYKSRSSINKIELGENDIPQSKIEHFAKALETSPAYLMGWTENADPAAAETELDNYLVEKLTSLSPAEEEKVLAYIDGLIANRQD